MTKREKVIKGLEQFIANFKPFCGNKSDWKRVDDTIALLKAQEPVVPIENAGFYYCGACRYAFTSARQKYCSECGRAVKWE